jgi:hypothetical protein
METGLRKQGQMGSKPKLSSEVTPSSTDLTGDGIREGSRDGPSGDQPATRRRPRQYIAPSQAAAAHDPYCASACVIRGHQVGFFPVDPPSVKAANPFRSSHFGVTLLSRNPCTPIQQ